jgi:hypothetical protein
MPRCQFATTVLSGLSLINPLAVSARAQQPEKPGPPAAAADSRVKPLDQETVLRLLRDEKPAEVRRAAESLQQSVPKDREQLLEVAEGVKSALSTTRDADAEASLRLALGKLAAAGVKDAPDWSLETAEWGFESMSVTHRPNKTPRKVFEAHVQALEMVPGAAKELMIGNLDVALNMPEVEPQERQRLKEFVTLTAEGMRTRELAVFLDALLAGEEDLFVKIEAPLEVRLLACYQHIKAQPPIRADAVVQWLEKHPGGPDEVEIAALETVSLVGTTKADAASKLAERLLAKPENALIIAKRLIAGHLHKSLLPQAKAALERDLQKQPSDELRKALQDLARFEKS